MKQIAPSPTTGPTADPADVLNGHAAAIGDHLATLETAVRHRQQVCTAAYAITHRVLALVAAAARLDALNGHIPHAEHPSGVHEHPGCSAALLPPGNGRIDPCLVKGRHATHQAADGATWTDDTEEPLR